MADRAPRLFISIPCEIGQIIEASPEQRHHLIVVNRLSIGSPVTLSASGKSFRGEVAETSPHLKIRVREELEHRAQPSFVQSLVVSPLQQSRHEWVLEKATELGVSEILLTTFDRSVVRWKDSESHRINRLSQIAEGAAAQSDRSRVPRVQICNSLAEALATNSNPVLFGDLVEQPGKATIATMSPTVICGVIGPEGDFSPAERALLTERRATPISLSSAILRTETAALALIISINALWGESMAS